MKLLAVTGNIGSGKTTVAKMLETLGCRVVYADELSRKAVENEFILQKITQTFGKDILQNDQTLNRKKLGEIVFSSKDSLQKLNAIVHPRIKKLFWQAIKKTYEKKPNALVIYEIPLLFEQNLQNKFQKIILVDSNTNLMLKRKSKQIGLAPQQVQKRLDFQNSTQKKKQLSDYILQNDKDLSFLQSQVSQVFEKLKKLEDLDLHGIKKLYFGKSES